jgi:hypothetical protein
VFHVFILRSQRAINMPYEAMIKRIYNKEIIQKAARHGFDAFG